MPGTYAAIRFFECLQCLAINRKVNPGSLDKLRINKREAFFPKLLIEPFVHLFDSSPKGFPFSRFLWRSVYRSDHGSNRPRRSMRVEPLPCLRITIGADFDVGTGWFMIGEIPAFPSLSSVRRILRRSIFLFINQVPLPGTLFFWQPFPRLIPQFMGSHVRDFLTPDRRLAQRMDFGLSGLLCQGSRLLTTSLSLLPPRWSRRDCDTRSTRQRC